MAQSTHTELENAEKTSKTTDLQYVPNDNTKRIKQNNSGGSYLKCPLPPNQTYTNLYFFPKLNEKLSHTQYMDKKR